MKGKSQHQVTLVWLFMLSIVSLVIATLTVIDRNNDAMREGDSWLSRKGGGRIMSMTGGDGEEVEDPIIDVINDILNHPDYVAPEETPKERVIREYNQRFQMMISDDYIE